MGQERAVIPPAPRGHVGDRCLITSVLRAGKVLSEGGRGLQNQPKLKEGAKSPCMFIWIINPNSLCNLPKILGVFIETDEFSVSF